VDIRSQAQPSHPLAPPDIAHGIPGGDEKGSLGGGRKEIRWEREEAEEGGKGKSLEDMK